MRRQYGTRRFDSLDTIRGITLVSMIAYHASWVLVYLYGVDWPFYHSAGAYWWQQSICWTFILLSGFCWSFSRNPLKQGLIVSGGGLVVTVVTLLVSYDSRVIFGVLNLIGASILLMIPLKRYLEKIPSVVGFIAMFLLFAVTYGINNGYLGFFGVELVELPGMLYKNLVTAFLGFPDPWFFSTDYFSLFPWCFLYFTGYFLYRMWKQGILPNAKCLDKKIPILTWMGRHSLLIYMAHQPVIYGILEILFW